MGVRDWLLGRRRDEGAPRGGGAVRPDEACTAFRCKHCGARLLATEEVLRGHFVPCPQCDGAVAVPPVSDGAVRAADCTVVRSVLETMVILGPGANAFHAAQRRTRPRGDRDLLDTYVVAEDPADLTRQLEGRRDRLWYVMVLETVRPGTGDEQTQTALGEAYRQATPALRAVVRSAVEVVILPKEGSAGLKFAAHPMDAEAVLRVCLTLREHMAGCLQAAQQDAGSSDSAEPDEVVIPLEGYEAFLTKLAVEMNENVVKLQKRLEAFCAECGVQFTEEALSHLYLMGPRSSYRRDRGDQVAIVGGADSGDALRAGKCPACGCTELRVRV